MVVPLAFLLAFFLFAVVYIIYKALTKLKSAKVSFCPDCSAEIGLSDMYCPSCGRKI